MTAGLFDFAPLLRPGLPPAAGKWTGLARYSFIGGNNDAEQVPVDGLVAAATTVLAREGAALATYGLASGPLGYGALREFLVAKLKRDAGISCSKDEILITSGSLQAIDLVNGILLAPGDTVVIEQETYQGAITRLSRLGVNAVGIPLDRDGLRVDALAAALDDLKGRNIRPKYIYTIPTVESDRHHHAAKSAGARSWGQAQAHGVPIFEDDCYADLIWDGGRRRQALHAMSRHGGVILSARSPNRSRRRCGSATSWQAGMCWRACWPSRPMRVPAPWSRWCWRNSAPRISASTCRGCGAACAPSSKP